MNKPHPPIPPGCKYFSEHEPIPNEELPEKWFSFTVEFEMGEDDGWGGQLICCTVLRASPKERPVIAAVARCVWLDIAAELQATIDSITKDELVFSSPETLARWNDLEQKKESEREVAMQNAAAWAEWGRGDD